MRDDGMRGVLFTPLKPHRGPSPPPPLHTHTLYSEPGARHAPLARLSGVVAEVMDTIAGPKAAYPLQARGGERGRRAGTGRACLLTRPLSPPRRHRPHASSNFPSTSRREQLRAREAAGFSLPCRVFSHRLPAPPPSLPPSLPPGRPG